MGTPMRTTYAISKGFAFFFLVLASLLIVACRASGWTNTLAYKFDPLFPEARHDLQFSRPAMRWDEALPLGNGMMGCLVWGDGHPLKLSLDRADLWDLRPVEGFNSPDYNFATLARWIKEKRVAEIRKLYEEAYDSEPAPTKIPAGRIEIEMGPQAAFEFSHLALESAEARVQFKDGAQLRVIQHARQAVGLARIENRPEPPMLRLRSPAFGGNPAGGASSLGMDLRRLGYPVAQHGASSNEAWFVQQGWKEFYFAVVVRWKKVGGHSWELAWSIATSNEGKDPLQIARTRTDEALATGYDRLLGSHRAWWENYWLKSGVRVPDAAIEAQWYRDTYKFGAASRRGAPPISLQAIWTADEGQIPPWKGDYHHDLNTQMSYWPAYSGNHLEEGLSFLDWLWQIRDVCREYTRKFYGLPGLNVPMTSTLDGRQMGGWAPYTHSSTTAAWLAHHFYLHWKYSGDGQFLRDRAYPYLKEAATFVEEHLQQDATGKLTLELSSSPEINDNRLDAWFPTITNYDLALCRWLFSACVEMTEALGATAEAARWRRVLDRLPEFALDNLDHRLLVATGKPLKESHRHFSHLMAIHPLGLIDLDNGPDDGRTIQGALEELDRLETKYWCGYSFAWHAALAARARDGQRAGRSLRIFTEAFCSPNSFHLNGDQTGKGYSNFRYRPFTLEGNFAAAAALQEMLLQSHHGALRVFPAVPAEWRDISFTTLRAQGGFLVSAQRRKGRVTLLEIRAANGGTVHIANPFPKGPLEMQLTGARILKKSDLELVIRFSRSGMLSVQAR